MAKAAKVLSQEQFKERRIIHAEPSGRSGYVIVMKAGAPREPVQSDQIEDPFIQMVTEGLVLAPPIEPEKLLGLTESNAIHSACVAAKTVDSVGHGWQYDRIDGEADEAEAKAVKFELDAVLEEITPEFTFSELLKQARWEAESVGWAAWETAREGENPDGEIVGIFPLPIHTLRAARRADKRRGSYCQIVGGETRYFVEFNSGLNVSRLTGQDLKTKGERSAREVIVFRPYSYASRYYGVPEWIAAAPAIAELGAIREYNISYFDSSGLADMILHCTANDVGEAEKLSLTIERMLKEARGQGHFIVTTWGSLESKVNPVEVSRQAGQKEGHFKERREDLVKEVLIAHNTPPYRIGWAEVGSLGGSAAREMLSAYRYGSIEPWQVIFEDRLAKTLFGKRGLNLRARGFRWVLVDLNWDQMELDLNIAVEGVRTGILSPNEAREILHKPKKDDPNLDKHYMNGVPVGEQAPGFNPFGPQGGDQPPGGNEPPPDPDAPEGDLAASIDGSDGAGALEKARVARFAKVEQARNSLLSPASGTLRGMLEDERSEVLSAIRRAGSGSAAIRAAEDVVTSRKKVWAQWFKRTYSGVTDRLAVDELEEMAANAASAKKSVTKGPKDKPDEKTPDPKKPSAGLRQSVIDFLGGNQKAQRTVDTWQKIVNNWLSKEAGQKIKYIEDTTRQTIRDELKEGVDAGEGIDDLAKRIDGIYGDEIIPNRAEVIARTEVISASNLGSISAVKAAAAVTGLVVKKRWLATRDGRTREDHLDAEGQEVDMDEPFEVGGEELMFPGDTSRGASAGNTIMCRCAVTYHPVTEEGGE
jgi:hypothetical protein